MRPYKRRVTESRSSAPCSRARHLHVGRHPTCEGPPSVDAKTAAAIVHVGRHPTCEGPPRILGAADEASQPKSAQS